MMSCLIRSADGWMEVVEREADRSATMDVNAPKPPMQYKRRRPITQTGAEGKTGKRRMQSSAV